MPRMPETLRPVGAPSHKEQQAFYDKHRGSARKRGYDSRWDKASKSFRRQHPLCEYCEANGKVKAAELVDHLYPHRKFKDVFWLKHWWVASCKDCHDGMKQSIEAGSNYKVALDNLAKMLGRPVMGRDDG